VSRRDPQAERALTKPGDPAAEFGVGGGGGTGGGDGAGRAAQDRAERAADRVHRRGTAFDRCGQDARLRHRVGPFQRRNGGQRWKGRRGSRHHQDGKDKRGDAAHVGRSVLLDVADNLAENRVRVTCPCRNGRDIAGIRRDPAVSRRRAVFFLSFTRFFADLPALRRGGAPGRARPTRLGISFASNPTSSSVRPPVTGTASARRTSTLSPIAMTRPVSAPSASGCRRRSGNTRAPAPASAGARPPRSRRASRRRRTARCR
jgi:hypothetical protein